MLNLLDALISLVVELAVVGFPLSIHQLESVRAVSIHVPVTVWGTTVREEEGHLVCSLRTKCDEVPKHICILNETHNKP